MVLGDRQEDTDDHQADRVRKSEAPERDGGERGKQQELQDTDDRKNDAAFIHRGTLGARGRTIAYFTSGILSASSTSALLLFRLLP
jgi:hypothetical protein